MFITEVFRNNQEDYYYPQRTDKQLPFYRPKKWLLFTMAMSLVLASVLLVTL